MRTIKALLAVLLVCLSHVCHSVPIIEDSIGPGSSNTEWPPAVIRTAGPGQAAQITMDQEGPSDFDNGKQKVISGPLEFGPGKKSKVEKKKATKKKSKAIKKAHKKKTSH